MANAYEQWVGREEESSERILGSAVRAMAATLDLEQNPNGGEPLPPGGSGCSSTPLSVAVAWGPMVTRSAAASCPRLICLAVCGPAAESAT